MKKHLLSAIALSIAIFATSCSDDDKVIKSSSNQVTDPVEGSTYAGFYLLNEGQMGMNQSTLDFFNYGSGIYTTDVYSEINPGVVKELGDIGNDLKIYDGKLFAVINKSNKIEVMNAGNARRIKQIDIQQCRSIIFHEDKAYVTSANSEGYSSEIDKVSEIDLNKLEVTRTIQTGKGPEGMVVSGGKLFVTNSGGFNFPDYEKTVAIVSLEGLEVTRRLDVVANPTKIFADKRGYIYVYSHGNYNNIKPTLQIIDTNDDYKLVKKIDDMEINGTSQAGDSLYFVSGQYSATPEYKILDLKGKDTKIISKAFITSESAKKIKTPYGIAVNRETKEVYITDAVDYKSNGYVYCFTSDGKEKWNTEAGNIPAHIALLPKAK